MLLPDPLHAPARRPKAFSSEVDTGSGKENASNQKPGAFYRFNEMMKGPRDRVIRCGRAQHRACIAG
jgi:hypothetical protein